MRLIFVIVLYLDRWTYIFIRYKSLNNKAMLKTDFNGFSNKKLYTIFT